MNPEGSETIEAAWQEFGDPRGIREITDSNTGVSTNKVVRMRLSDDSVVFGKLSSYGNFVHFRQDHARIHGWRWSLRGTRFADLLAPVLGRGKQPFVYRGADGWVAFYAQVPFYDFLPKVLTDGQVAAFGREMGEFHLACHEKANRLEPTWKSLGSDVAILYGLLGDAGWLQRRGFSDEVADLVKLHCDRFLQNAEVLGYHHWRHIPVLVDWNIGNFSVGLDGEGLKLYTRWDYDWFRIEPRVMDLYSCSRVVRSEGDRTDFSYLAEPLLDPRFQLFLREYVSVFPLTDGELLFVKEAYRFFVLNYVIRDGSHFFRADLCARLQREAVERYLPALDSIEFGPLLELI